MSEYIHIFARQNDQFVPLYSEGRSGYLHGVLRDFAPWEKVSLLKRSQILDAIETVDNSIYTCKRLIDKKRRVISEIQLANNSVEEKTEYIEDAFSDIANYEEEMSAWETTKVRLEFIENIIVSMEDSKKYDDGAKDLGLYIGVECGEHISADDVEAYKPCMD